MVVRSELEALRTGVRFSPAPPKVFLTRYLWGADKVSTWWKKGNRQLDRRMS